jgi:acyl-CoA thioester hydrolase
VETKKIKEKNFMPKVKYDLEVYTYQIDIVHHLSNIVYIEWMEIGRIKLLEAMGLPIEELEKRGILPVLTETQIRYRKPIYFGDQVRGEIWVGELGAASAILKFRFYKNNDILAAEGWQKGLFINVETKKPYRLRNEERERFENFLQKEKGEK